MIDPRGALQGRDGRFVIAQSPQRVASGVECFPVVANGSLGPVNAFCRFVVTAEGPPRGDAPTECPGLIRRDDERRRAAGGCVLSPAPYQAPAAIAPEPRKI